MNYWLYPSNTKFYDVLGAMAEQETYWPMNSKAEIGDNVFIYLAAPQKQVVSLCEVTATHLVEAGVMRHVQAFLKDKPPQEKVAKLFMKLKPTMLITVEKESPLGLSSLKANGLTGMLMGPRKLNNNPELLGYILECIGEA